MVFPSLPYSQYAVIPVLGCETIVFPTFPLPPLKVKDGKMLFFRFHIPPENAKDVKASQLAVPPPFLELQRPEKGGKVPGNRVFPSFRAKISRKKDGNPLHLTGFTSLQFF